MCIHERLVALQSNGDMLACAYTSSVGMRVHYPWYHVQEFLARLNAIAVCLTSIVHLYHDPLIGLLVKTGEWNKKV